MMMHVLVYSPPFCSALRMLDSWPFSNIIWFPYSLWRKLIVLPYSFIFLSTPALLRVPSLQDLRWLKATFSTRFVSQTRLKANSKWYIIINIFVYLFIFIYVLKLYISSQTGR